jgi:hypothetical protein
MLLYDRDGIAQDVGRFLEGPADFQDLGSHRMAEAMRARAGHA